MTVVKRLSLRRVAWVCLAVCSLGHFGCAVVKPWERGKLASPAMEARFGEDGFAGEYRGKMLESKLGGGLPGDAPGGGCGCTQ